MKPPQKDRLTRLHRRYEEYFSGRPAVSFALQYLDGTQILLGPSSPVFRLVSRNSSGDAALDSQDRLVIGEAFMASAIDIEGDILVGMSVRGFFSDRHPVAWAKRFLPRIAEGRLRGDEKVIAAHYDNDADFFLSFLDSRHRCYTQGSFAGEAESLEDAMSRKLTTALDSLRVNPGDCVLDVGGGWGAFLEFASRRGLHITSLTLSQASADYLRSLVAQESLSTATVVRRHLFDYRPDRRFDAIVNMGVTEHLPNYAATLRSYQRLLRPGGRIYIDALAMRKRHHVSSYMSKYIYPGDASPLILHRFLREVARSPFSIEAIVDERENYYLTCKAWAQRLDKARVDVEARWGRQMYRRYSAFLWGSASGFWTGHLDAYRLHLQLPDRGDAGRY
ncbi:SAM-dependent methyltransferase [Blastococcus jejuensis]|uniref:SAM-dependent methyltransferase n=1 Tax=Blastococcus jejuensis TaxID=351224 RepID=UPI0031D2F1C5